MSLGSFYKDTIYCSVVCRIGWLVLLTTLKRHHQHYLLQKVSLSWTHDLFSHQAMFFIDFSGYQMKQSKKHEWETSLWIFPLNWPCHQINNLMDIIFNNLLFYTHCKNKVTYLQTTAFFSSKSTPLNILDLYFTQTRRQFSKTCSTVAERTVPACKHAIFTEFSVDISVSPLPSHSFPFLLLRW